MSFKGGGVGFSVMPHVHLCPDCVRVRSEAGFHYKYLTHPVKQCNKLKAAVGGRGRRRLRPTMDEQAPGPELTSPG